jgi:anti-sigma factor RsiW
MNCTTVEKLLPLYVEGDATAREAESVRAHLSSCAACRRVEEEFAASQSRLHNFAVPEFGAEFYEQLRGAVLKEISDRPAARPSVFETLRAGLQWRTAAAFSLALMIMAGAVSFAFYRSLQPSDAALLAIEQSMGDLSPLPEPATERAANESGEVGASIHQTGSTTTVARNVLRQRLARGAQSTAQSESSNAQSPDNATLTVAEAQRKNAAASLAASTTPAQAVARMEIQTSDPNIRIIWLARKSGE